MAAAVVGALWAYVRWEGGRSPDWMVNVSISTEVLPYGDDTRLLVVHVHLRNPSDVSIDLHKPEDSFQVSISTVPDKLEPGDLLGMGGDDVFATDDLLPDEGYRFIPRAEFDDVTAVVVPADASYVVEAQIARGSDFVSATTVVFVAGTPAADGALPWRRDQRGVPPRPLQPTAPPGSDQV